MNNVAFKQETLFYFESNTGCCHSIKLVGRFGDSYGIKYVLIFKRKYKDTIYVKRSVYKNWKYALSKMRLLLMQETLDNINYMINMPF